MMSVERAPAGAAIAGCRRVVRRQRDRRRGLAELLASLAQHVRAGRDEGVLRTEFERCLREILRLRAVRLREEPTAYGLPADPSGTSVSLDVPGRTGGRRVLLDVHCGTMPLDDWGYQVLGMAADVAALLLEIDHRRPVPVGAGKTAPTNPPPLVGHSLVMRGLRERIARVASTDFTVLIEGESGTGKELVARQIHDCSRRRVGPFVAVNCAAIVETLLEAELFGIEERTATGVRGRHGKFEHADGGTLFLDEVADLAPAAQAKLLRAIQELTVERVGGHTSRRVDARIVVATNRSLRDLEAHGLFRGDLFYRLSGVELHVPPLRARREDIAELAAHFLARCRPGKPFTLSAAASQALRAYEWPGNVRELERALEAAVTAAKTDVIGLEDLPAIVRKEFSEIVMPSLGRGDSMRAWGRRYAALVLERCGGNKRRACDVLDISYHTLQAYLRGGPAGQPEESSLEENGSRSECSTGWEDSDRPKGHAPLDREQDADVVPTDEAKTPHDGEQDSEADPPE